MPYSEAEIGRVDALIEEMNAAPLAFVLHVGDIGSSSALQACSDAWVLERKKQFARIRHPFILVPGDNEWSDCKEPVQKLRQWRRLFCFSDARVSFETQKGEFCEHIRWESGGTLFAVLNVAGSNNNVRHAEHAPRMAAVMAWLDESAALAEKRELRLAVVMHANPFVTTPRDGYAALRQKLAALGAGRAGKVVLIHGDTHIYRDDEPLPGLRRIEVWGSPFVSWLRLAF